MRVIPFLFFFFFWALSPKITAQQTFRVMIDAGHGGKDNGTTGANSVEKDIVLDIAEKLQVKSNSEIEIILTRNSDEFIKLKKRSELANKQNVDLFISLHCNHINLSYVHGSEVYVYGSAHSHEDHSIANRENGGFNEDSETDGNMSFILQGIESSAFLEQSLTFGTQVVSAFESSTTLRQRGLKQANFRVLKFLDMPGVLLEIAYLSNPANEAYILSEKGKDAVSLAIWDSIMEYKESLPKQAELFLSKRDK